MSSSEDRQVVAIQAALQGNERPGQEFGLDAKRAQALQARDVMFKDNELRRSSVDGDPSGQHRPIPQRQQG